MNVIPETIPKHIQKYVVDMAGNHPSNMENRSNSYTLCPMCGGMVWRGASAPIKDGEEPHIEITSYALCNGCEEFEHRFPDVFNYLVKVFNYQIFKLGLDEEEQGTINVEMRI